MFPQIISTGGIMAVLHVMFCWPKCLQHLLKIIKYNLQKAILKTIQGYVQLDGDNLSQQIKINIPEAGLQTTVTTDANGKASFSIPVKTLTYWSPENPKRYKVLYFSSNDRLC